MGIVAVIVSILWIRKLRHKGLTSLSVSWNLNPVALTPDLTVLTPLCPLKWREEMQHATQPFFVCERDIPKLHIQYSDADIFLT